MQPGLDGAVLLISAAFEQFVSDLLIAFSADLPGKVASYDHLPKAVKSANERYTGEALDRSRSRFADYELRRFVSNLRDCLTGATPYTLNGEAIALNDRNLKANTLRELFGRLGIKDVWTEIGATRTLQRWSGPGGAKTAKSRAQSRLNELIDNRNRIAHRVGGTALGPDEILSYAHFGRTLARCLVKVLEDYASVVSLKQIDNQSASPPAHREVARCKIIYETLH
ncbi:MAG: hypothetical protein HYY00_03070 [Chloroflexi bacterium]|nr:hypothetical protein [Chloroflexota bacterium]